MGEIQTGRRHGRQRHMAGLRLSARPALALAAGVMVLLAVLSAVPAVAATTRPGSGMASSAHLVQVVASTSSANARLGISSAAQARAVLSEGRAGAPGQDRRAAISARSVGGAYCSQAGLASMQPHARLEGFKRLARSGPLAARCAAGLQRARAFIQRDRPAAFSSGSGSASTTSPSIHLTAAVTSYPTTDTVTSPQGDVLTVGGISAPRPGGFCEVFETYNPGDQYLPCAEISFTDSESGTKAAHPIQSFHCLITDMRPERQSAVPVSRQCFRTCSTSSKEGWLSW